MPRKHRKLKKSNVDIEENSENNDITEIKEIENKEETIQEKAEDSQEKTDNQKKEQKQMIMYKENKILKRIIITIIVIIIALTLSFAGIIVLNKLNSNVYKNVYVLNTDMSGKNSEEIMNFLESKKEEYSKGSKAHIYQNDEEIFTIESESINFEMDIAKTTQKVLNFGREGNIFKSTFHILKAMFNKEEIKLEFTYDKEKVEDILKNIDLTISDRYVDDNYILDEINKKLEITIGKSGNSIDYEKEKEKILSYFSNPIENKIQLDIILKSPTKLDVNKVYEEVKREVKDAYIDKSVEPYKFVNEVTGLDFKIEELQKNLELEENKEDGKKINFQLNVTEPKVKLADITYKLYKDKLAGYTTYFSPNLWGRSRNLEIALSYINGKIVMPGETFSYAKAVGDINASKGYQYASTFVGGKEVMDIGGGICQTVSTLYNTVLLANLQIIERHQHGLPVSYVRPSIDATVYVPVLDFKFKNTRKYPVKIVTSFSWGGNLNVSIYGTKEEKEYEIILTSNYIKTIPFSVKYINDPNLEVGKQVVDVKGINGFTSQSYITKKLNGELISSNVLSTDTYKAQQQVVRIGKKEKPIES